MFQSLDKVDAVIVDEWHVLVNQKRGILFELFLSWLSTFNKSFKRWALSATISSTKIASAVLNPIETVVSVKDPYKKEIKGDILLPKTFESRLNKMGRHLLPELIEKIKTVKSSIIFTNTRSQSEQWYQLLLDSKAFKKTELGIHHSAVSAESRSSVEAGIKAGKIRCIVATSSLDLGVDLEPVDLVIHIGSPKGMARLKQRAGRSGHSPFEASEILLVPRHGFEVIESLAAITHINDTVHDDLTVHELPIDILMQHIINICMSASYTLKELLSICQNTHTFSKLSSIQLSWLLEFCCNENTLLKAYPEHIKLIKKGTHFETNKAPLIQKSQRFGVGTITSDDFLIVKYTNQKTLGTIEEQFIRQLQPKDTFLFSGYILSIIRIQDDIVFVKKAKSKLPKYTRWYGGYMSYSSQLANYLLEQLDQFLKHKKTTYPIATKFLQAQYNQSDIPKHNQCLIEILTIDNCPTLFIYPFCGRAANQAIAMSLTYAITKQYKCTSAMTVNDYGLMIQVDKDINLKTFNFNKFITLESIRDLSYKSFNQNEMVLQEFRQICLISGLIYKGMPGRLKTGRYTQSSVRILFDIFKEYDPTNLLLKQARDIIFHAQLFPKQLEDRLQIINNNILIKYPKKISPFGYTLYQEQLSAKMDDNGN